MSLERETDLGMISVSNLLFAQIILESFKLESCRGRVWAATKKGKPILSEKHGIAEFASSIETENSLDGESVDLEFSIIVKFGTSIRNVTDILGDSIAEAIQRKLGKKPGQIKIRIVGVKSRQLAKRNLEVIKRYGA